MLYIYLCKEYKIMHEFISVTLPWPYISHLLPPTLPMPNAQSSTLLTSCCANSEKRISFLNCKLEVIYQNLHRVVTCALAMVLLQDITEWSIWNTSLRDSAGACPPEAKSIERWTSWMGVKFNHEWKYWYLTCLWLAVIFLWLSSLQHFSST